MQAGHRHRLEGETDWWDAVLQRLDKATRVAGSDKTESDET